MENWKDICGYEGYYQVSDLGRVRSLDRIIYQKIKGGVIAKKIYPGCILKQSIRNGYFSVSLKMNGDGKHKTVHRLIAIAFIDNPQNKPLINHINGIKKDNRISNLEWCTAKENSQHALNTGLHKPSLSKEAIQKANDAFCKETICVDNGMVFKSAYEAAIWVNETKFFNTKKVQTIAAKIRSCRNGRAKSVYGYHFQLNK